MMTTSTVTSAQLPEVLTVEETAQLLRVSTKTVYSLIKAGRLCAYRAGRAFRLRKDAVLRYLEGTAN